MDHKTILNEIDIDLYGEHRQLTPKDLEALCDMVQLMRKRRTEHIRKDHFFDTPHG